MNSLPLFLRYARYPYIAYKIFLRIKMGKSKRDEYLQKIRLSPIDFLPEVPYLMSGGAKAIPRRGTRDFHMLFLPREDDVKPHLSMREGETFVDVGANVGAYTLTIANQYKDKGVKVIAIEAHPENYKALCRNIQINNFRNVSTINKAAADHKGIISLYERSHDGSRVGSDLYSLCSNPILHQANCSNLIHPQGKALLLECDTLDSMLVDQRIHIMKMDIEGAEVLALKGATRTLGKLRKVFVEIHENNLCTVEQILRNHDFHTEVIDKKMTHVVGSRDI